jgi:hypothetical protein
MILALGIINLILLAWQLLTGLHVIKASPATHRKTGILLVITAVLHGSMALLV